MAWNKVETSRLTRLLNVLPAFSPEEIHKNVRGEIPGTTLAFNALDKRPSVPVEEKARIEFARLSLLEQSEHGIPNLEERIAEPPTSTRRQSHTSSNERTAGKIRQN